MKSVRILPVLMSLLLLAGCTMPSGDELLAAQKDPEHYKHIIVRVTGFSCPFIMLSKEWQEEVLSRNYYD